MGVLAGLPSVGGDLGSPLEKWRAGVAGFDANLRSLVGVGVGLPQGVGESGHPVHRRLEGLACDLGHLASRMGVLAGLPSVGGDLGSPVEKWRAGVAGFDANLRSLVGVGALGPVVAGPSRLPPGRLGQTGRSAGRPAQRPGDGRSALSKSVVTFRKNFTSASTPAKIYHICGIVGIAPTPCLASSCPLLPPPSTWGINGLARGCRDLGSLVEVFRSGVAKWQMRLGKPI